MLTAWIVVVPLVYRLLLVIIIIWANGPNNNGVGYRMGWGVDGRTDRNWPPPYRLISLGWPT